MSVALGPDGFEVTPTHDGLPMIYKGSRISFEGDFEICVMRYECACGFTCEVHTREMDGGPEVAKARQRGWRV